MVKALSSSRHTQFLNSRTPFRKVLGVAMLPHRADAVVEAADLEAGEAVEALLNHCRRHSNSR